MAMKWREAWCGLVHGHHTVVRHVSGGLSLECLECGWTSPGVAVHAESRREAMMRLTGVCPTCGVFLNGVLVHVEGPRVLHEPQAGRACPGVTQRGLDEMARAEAGRTRQERIRLVRRAGGAR